MVAKVPCRCEASYINIMKRIKKKGGGRNGYSGGISLTSVFRSMPIFLFL